MRIILFMGCLCLPLAFASGVPPVVEAIYEKYKYGLQGWAYTQTTVLEDETLVERFDPRNDPALQWELLLVDGQPPEPDRLEDYRERKEEALQRFLERSEEERVKTETFLRGLIEDVEFDLTAEDDATQVFRLDLPETDRKTEGFSQWLMREICEDLQGELVVDPEREELLSIRFWNTEKISPVLSVAFNEIDLSLTMGWHPEHETFLPVSSRDILKGRKLFIGRIDRQAEITFSDFERVPPEENRSLLAADEASPPEPDSG